MPPRGSLISPGGPGGGSGSTDVGYANQHAVPVDGVTDASAALAAMDASASYTGGVLVVRKGETLYVNSDLTLANLSLDVRNGGQVSVGGAHIFKADLYRPGTRRIIDTAATGQFVPTRMEEWTVAWWGALGGTTDDSVAWAKTKAAADVIHTAFFTGFISGQKVRPLVGENRILDLDMGACNIDCGGLGVSMISVAGSPAAGAGHYLIKIGSWGQLHDGYINGRGKPIDLVWNDGTRSHCDTLYIAASGCARAFVAGNSASSLTQENSHIFILGDRTAGSIGYDLQSSDVKSVSIWIGDMDIAVNWIWGGQQVDGLHTWGCIRSWLGAPTISRILDSYNENNDGWGADLVGTNGMVLVGYYWWANGKVTANTGHLRMSNGGNAAKNRNNLIGEGIMDDHRGVGIQLESAVGTTIRTRFHSQIVEAGGAPVSDVGISLDASCSDTRIEADMPNRFFITASIQDASPDAYIDLGRKAFKFPADLVKNAIGVSNWGTGMTFAARDKWIVERGFFAYDGPTDGDIRIGFASGVGDADGYLMFLQLVANSTASLTAASVVPLNCQRMNVATPTILTGGTIGVGSRQGSAIAGTFIAGATPGTLNLQAAQITVGTGNLTLYKDGSVLELRRVA